jgi:ABC-type sugar transport system substrate-binding protein
MKPLLLTGVVTALLTLAPLYAANAAEAAAPQKAAIGDWGVDTRGLSTTVKPGNDFYRYVNEAWLKAAKIPTRRVAIRSASRCRRGTIILTKARPMSTPGTRLST